MSGQLTFSSKIFLQMSLRLTAYNLRPAAGTGQFRSQKPETAAAGTDNPEFRNQKLEFRIADRELWAAATGRARAVVRDDVVVRTGRKADASLLGFGRRDEATDCREQRLDAAIVG